MKTILEIQSMANAKLEDADVLYNNGKYDSAQYLGGYAIELLLKAKICKNFGIENFYENGSMMTKLNWPQTFKVHDLNQLFILAGLHKEFESVKNENELIDSSWMAIRNWNANERYNAGHTKEKTIHFLTSIKIIAQWILTYL